MAAVVAEIGIAQATVVVVGVVVVVVVVAIAWHFQYVVIVVGHNTCIPRQNAQRRSRHSRCQDQRRVAVVVVPAAAEAVS